MKKEEGLTVREIQKYQKEHPLKVETYGKYGMLAKQYLEEHNPAKLWELGKELPEYLHGIDKQAEELYETLYEKLSASEQYKKTGDYLEDVQIETEKQKRIDEQILTEIVFVD